MPEDRPASAISGFHPLCSKPNVRKGSTVVLGKHKSRPERQFGSGSYTSVVCHFSL